MVNASSAEESFRSTNRSSSCLSVSPPSTPSPNSVRRSRSAPDRSPPLMSLPSYTGLPTSICTCRGNPSNLLPEKSGNASLVSTARSPRKRPGGWGRRVPARRGGGGRGCPRGTPGGGRRGRADFAPNGNGERERGRGRPRLNSCRSVVGAWRGWRVRPCIDELPRLRNLAGRCKSDRIDAKCTWHTEPALRSESIATGSAP